MFYLKRPVKVRYDWCLNVTTTSGTPNHNKGPHCWDGPKGRESDIVQWEGQR